LKVLHVINSFPVAGAERVLSLLLPRLQAAGIDVQLLVTTDYKSHLLDAAESAGIEVIRASCRKVGHPASLVGTLRALSTHRSDLVHAHLFPAHALVWLNQKLSQQKAYIVTEHNSDSWRWANPLLRKLDNAVFTSSHTVIAVSDSVRAALLERFELTPDRIEVIYNGIDLSFLAACRPSPDLDLMSGGGRKLIFVGRLTYQKGIDDLIGAMPLLDRDVHLFVCGDGELLSRLIQTAGALGVQERVHFLGLRNDVPSLIKAADAFVLPSLYEGYGLALVEAMACGTPVVHSDCPALIEVAGGSGLICRTGVRESIAAKLKEILGDRHLAVALSQKAKARAALFSVTRTVEAHIRLYERVLS
jgi:glycosyltransferase involved in cell wall biosynthesis